MRLFIAIELPDDIRETLSVMQSDPRRAYVAPRALHQQNRPLATDH
ncbi:MAG: hypothetical protein ACKV2V_12985 [Blastocatellia bacterium]